MANTPQQAIQEAIPVTGGHGARKALGMHLVEAGKLNPANIERACRLQREQEQWEPIGIILVKLGLVSEHDVAESLSTQLRLPMADRKIFPDELPIDERISHRFLKESRALILDEDEDRLSVAMADPLNRYVREALALKTEDPKPPREGVAHELVHTHRRNERSAAIAMTLPSASGMVPIARAPREGSSSSLSPRVRLPNELGNSRIE